MHGRDDVGVGVDEGDRHAVSDEVQSTSDGLGGHEGVGVAEARRRGDVRDGRSPCT